MVVGRAVASAWLGGSSSEEVQEEDTHVDSMAWIEALPRGAYTTARTVDGGRRVFRLSMHVQRLSESARAMAEAEAKEAGAEGGAADAAALLLPPPPALRAAAERVMARAVRRALRQRKENEEEEVKLTLLLIWPPPRGSQEPTTTTTTRPGADTAAGTAAAAASTAGRCRLLCHAQALPSPPRPPLVRAVACGTPRANARAKDSAWVRERKEAVDLAKRAAAALDAAATATTAAAAAAAIPVEETLLVGADGALEEGASSNFFALTRDGALQTAGEESVLPGTVRAVVLAVARAGVAEKRAGWPVSRVEEGAAPRLANAASWRACFLSSTSRQLLPVDQLLDATAAAGTEAAGLPAPVPRVAFCSPLAAAGGGGGGGGGGDDGVVALVAAVRAAILADSEPLPLDGEE